MNLEQIHLEVSVIQTIINDSYHRKMASFAGVAVATDKDAKVEDYQENFDIYAYIGVPTDYVDKERKLVSPVVCGSIARVLKVLIDDLLEYYLESDDQEACDFLLNEIKRAGLEVTDGERTPRYEHRAD